LSRQTKQNKTKTNQIKADQKHQRAERTTRLEAENAVEVDAQPCDPVSANTSTNPVLAP
jgi:hypothetical protein